MLVWSVGRGKRTAHGVCLLQVLLPPHSELARRVGGILNTVWYNCRDGSKGFAVRRAAAAYFSTQFFS
jgi:hypothetical protein